MDTCDLSALLGHIFAEVKTWERERKNNKLKSKSRETQTVTGAILDLPDLQGNRGYSH